MKKYSRNALLGSFVSMLTAGLATMMYSVSISTIRTDLALTAVQAGSLGTYTFMGQMLGGMVAGYLADRYGRKNILIVDVILATLAVFATSLLHLRHTPLHNRCRPRRMLLHRLHPHRRVCAHQ